MPRTYDRSADRARAAVRACRATPRGQGCRVVALPAARSGIDPSSSKRALGDPSPLPREGPFLESLWYGQEAQHAHVCPDTRARADSGGSYRWRPARSLRARQSSVHDQWMSRPRLHGMVWIGGVVEPLLGLRIKPPVCCFDGANCRKAS
jgi:hypothetical protein